MGPTIQSAPTIHIGLVSATDLVVARQKEAAPVGGAGGDSLAAAQ